MCFCFCEFAIINFIYNYLLPSGKMREGLYDTMIESLDDGIREIIIRERSKIEGDLENPVELKEIHCFEIGYTRDEKLKQLLNTQITMLFEYKNEKNFLVHVDKIEEGSLKGQILMFDGKYNYLH